MDPSLEIPPAIGSITRPCAQCRARKVKCDRQESGCSGCTRLGIPCSYIDGTLPEPMSSVADGRLTRGGTKRQRTMRACVACNTQRVKCSGELPCERCRYHGITCLERPSRRYPSTAVAARDMRRPSGSTGSPASSEMQILGSTPSPLTGQGLHTSGIYYHLGLNNPTIKTYLDAYFNHKDPLTCMFLHKATFMNELRNERLDTYLLKIVLAFGARLSTADATLPEAWAKEVELNVLSHYHEISMAQLRTVVVLLHYTLYYGRFDSTWMLLGIAARIAFSKRLNHEMPSSDIVAQESSRRLMWSVFMVDKMIGGGISDMSVCPTSRMHLRLPGNDRCFGYGIAAKTQCLKDTERDTYNDMGSLAYNIRLGDIRDRILTYTKDVIRSGTNPSESEAVLHAFVDELHTFKDNLPTELNLTSQNLILRSHTPHLTGYLVLHTHWYQCHCDLYRFTIPGIREAVSPEAMATTPTAYKEMCQRECLHAAIANLNLWADAAGLHVEKPLNSFSFAVCLYQSMKIIQHLSDLLPESGDRCLVELSRKMWTVFGVLEGLRHTYPMIEKWIGDLHRLIIQLSSGSRSDSAESPKPSNLPDIPRPSKHSFLPPLQDDRSDYSGTKDAPNINVASISSVLSNPDALPVETWPQYEGYANDHDQQSGTVFDSSVDFMLDPFDIRFNAYSGIDAGLAGFPNG